MIARAFTLIEVLVVIAVIAVLIAIALPALGAARSASLRTVGISNLRQVGVTFGSYADQYKAFPYAARGITTMPGEATLPIPMAPPDLVTVKWFPGEIVLATPEPFDLEWLWPGLLRHVTSWQESYNTWVSPGRNLTVANVEDAINNGDLEPNSMISVRYSRAFLASPELFKPGAPADEKLRAAVRPSDIVFPDRKAMLYDADLGWLKRNPPTVNGLNQALTPIYFPDGHAALHDPTAATPGVTNPLSNDSRAIHNTPEGVRGRDF